MRINAKFVKCKELEHEANGAAPGTEACRILLVRFNEWIMALRAFQS